MNEIEIQQENREKLCQALKGKTIASANVIENEHHYALLRIIFRDSSQLDLTGCCSMGEGYIGGTYKGLGQTEHSEIEVDI